MKSFPNVRREDLLFALQIRLISDTQNVRLIAGDAQQAGHPCRNDRSANAGTLDIVHGGDDVQSCWRYTEITADGLPE